MKKIKSLVIGILCVCMTAGIIPSTNVRAANDGTAVILPQYLSSRVCEMGNVFYDAIAFDICNIDPNYTYDIYYRKYGSKKYRFYKTYTEKGHDEREWDFWDECMSVPGIKYHNNHRMWLTRTAANTKYYIRVRTRETGRWSKTGTFWSAAKTPKYKRSGRRLTWNKSKGATGYFTESRKYVWYEWHDGVPVYFGDYYYDNKFLSSNKRSLIAPKGYSARCVYSYTKHGKYYYVDGYGCFTNKKELYYVPGAPEDAYKVRKRSGLNALFDEYS